MFPINKRMISKRNSLLKRVLNRHVKMFPSDKRKAVQLIALINQFNRLKFSENRESIPSNYENIVNNIEGLLDERPSNYSNLEVHCIGPITLDFVGENIKNGVTGYKNSVKCIELKRVLSEINIALFDTPADLSDISSGEFSNNSTPSQLVPDDDEPLVTITNNHKPICNKLEYCIPIESATNSDE